MTRLFSSSKRMADQSTVAVQKKEAKEKIPKREIAKASPEKFVDKSIDKQNENSAEEIKRRGLSKKIENPEKKEKPVKGSKTVNVVSKTLDLSSEDRETLSKYNKEWGDEEKLKKRLDSLKALQQDNDRMRKLLGKKGSRGVPENKLFKTLMNKYTKRDKNKKTGKVESQFHSFEEVMGKGKNEKLNIFQKFWLRITNISEYARYLAIKRKLKSELLLYRTGDEMRGVIGEQVNKGLRIAEEVRENVGNVVDPLKENPATKKAARGVLKAFKTQALLIFKSGRNVNTSIFEAETRQSTGKLLNDGLEKGKGSFLKMALKGQVPGVNAKMSGGFMVLEVVTRGLLDAIRQGDIGAFPRTISSSNAWLEAIPGVGSWNSIGRLFSDNGDPLWAKLLDAGVNVVGDGILAVGFLSSIYTGGLSIAAAATARGGITAYSKSLLKKQVLKQALKKGVSKVTTKVGTKEGRKQLGKSALKGTGKAAAQTGKVTLTMAAIQQAFERAFPSGTVKRVATKVALKQLTPQQSRLVKMGMKNAT